ncbi:MAG: PDR/VanB family oxidoreductase [Gammaproteobacteria bacterium]|nr:PDR/VanB family oxidoreductase [Gammaproteobacteria bacterium]
MNAFERLQQTALRVTARRDEADDILSLALAAPDGSELPPVEPGSHLVVHLANGLVRQYSLTDSAGRRDHYHLGILRDPRSRGGSAFIHDRVEVGATLEVTGPRNHFPLVPGAARSLLIAGGIGITPILSMARSLHAADADFELHYCARSRGQAAFVDWLENSGFADRVHFHFDGGDRARGLDVTTLLQPLIPGQHLYCCGPTGLMDAVEAAASHWPRGSVHFERFKANQDGLGDNRPFRMVLTRSGLELEVPAERSALDVLRDHGFEIESICEEGVCGSCLVDVEEGEIDHRDQILTPAERRDNDVMTVCCSRALGEILVLNL